MTLRKHLAATVGVVAIVGAVCSPIVASAISANSNTIINATVNAVISITSGPTVAIGLTPTSSAVVSSSSDTVSVSTNNTAGYYLTLADGDTNRDLVSGSNTITPHAGTFASPTVLATGTWGYRVVGAGGFGAGAYSGESNATSSSSTWAGVPASGSPQTLKTTSSTAANDVTTVWYGAKVDTTKPTGTYTDTVTYTAVTN